MIRYGAIPFATKLIPFLFRFITSSFSSPSPYRDGMAYHMTMRYTLMIRVAIKMHCIASSIIIIRYIVGQNLPYGISLLLRTVHTPTSDDNQQPWYRTYCIVFSMNCIAITHAHTHTRTHTHTHIHDDDDDECIAILHAKLHILVPSLCFLHDVYERRHLSITHWYDTCFCRSYYYPIYLPTYLPTFHSAYRPIRYEIIFNNTIKQQQQLQQRNYSVVVHCLLNSLFSAVYWRAHLFLPLLWPSLHPPIQHLGIYLNC